MLSFLPPPSLLQITSLPPEAAPLALQFAPLTPVDHLQLSAARWAASQPVDGEPCTPVAARIPAPTCPGAPRGPDPLEPTLPAAEVDWETPHLAPCTPTA